MSSSAELLAGDGQEQLDQLGGDVGEQLPTVAGVTHFRASNHPHGTEIGPLMRSCEAVFASADAKQPADSSAGWLRCVTGSARRALVGVSILRPEITNQPLQHFQFRQLPPITQLANHCVFEIVTRHDREQPFAGDVEQDV